METSIEKTATTFWDKSKWLIKGFFIGLLALLLMIPMMFVKNLVHEREERQQEASREITGKWAGSQNIVGPLIGIPFWKDNEGDTATKKFKSKHIAYFLPDVLNITATVHPKEKHRGIFKVMLYDSKTTISGSFNKLEFEKLNIAADKFIWNEAFIKMHIADVKGLNDQLTLKWNDSNYELFPTAGNIKEGMVSLLNTTTAADFNNIRFSTNIDLNGSGKLFFTPTGKATTVNINSPWKDPSFSGNMLPQETEISNNGFNATWKSMSHTRNFPQQWVDNDYRIDHYFPSTATYENVVLDRNGRFDVVTYPQDSGISIGTSSFGVDLFIPVNGYQKTLRTIKYALLCILLTFAAFFLIETTNKKPVHPFQYGLVGLALVLFYTLLLSISEYTGFNVAYMVASVATISLIAWFVKGIMQSARTTTILSVVLVLIYSFVFSLLQLQDYSLLLGSIGLFLSLAVVMHFSRKLQW